MIIPNLDFGGAQVSFFKLASDLSKSNNIFITAFNSKENAYDFDFKFIDLNIPQSNIVLFKIINFVKRIYKVRKVKKGFDIHISISFLEGADYVNILSRKNDKTIISIRGSKSFDETIIGWIGWIRKKIFIPWFYNKADAVVVVNEGIKKELIKNFGINKPKINVIYNYFDVNELKNLSNEVIEPYYKQLFDKKVLISSGRLAIEKGFHHLIEVFAIVKQKVVDLNLVLIGDGPFKSVLITKCKENNLSYFETDQLNTNASADVNFLGYKSNPLKYMKKADAFVLSSSSEGFPNALIEAMTCDLPILSTDCPSGPAEILSPDNSNYELPYKAKFGYLLPPFNGKDLERVKSIWVETLINIFESMPQKSINSRNKHTRYLDFTKEMIFPFWEKVINEISKN